ncbi:MAG: 50S ribosomal protein L11 [bacterium]|nr:50S ribosomal protein L11 [bacterium]
MAKKITKKLKIVAPAGKATPAPPLGTTLGPAGINIGEFVRKFNEATQSRLGNLVPCEITIYDDRSYDFVLKTSPASGLIMKKLGKEKGSGKPSTQKIGVLTKQQLREIAEEKMVDLNTTDIEQAMRTIAGSARSMGVDVK